MISMLFRKETIIILITGGIAFAASNTGNNVQWLVFSLLCAYLLLGRLASYLNSRKIEIEILSLPDIFAAQTSFIPFKVINRSSFRNAYHLHISMKFIPDAVCRDVFILKLGKNEEKTLFAEAVFQNRGEFALKHITILSSFPFDIVKNRRKLSSQEKIIAYPAIVNVDSRSKLYAANNYEIPAMRRGEGSEILNLYQYSGNEPLRNIHWKLSAKKDELWVKEFACEESPKVIIFLDWRKIPPAKRENAISVAASLAIKYNNSSVSWRLISGDFDSDFGSSTMHLRKCLVYLALLNDYKQPKGLNVPEITLTTHYSHLLYMSQLAH